MIVGKANMAYVSFIAVVAAVGGFLFGYDTAVISGTIDVVGHQFSLDALQKGWYVGCALVGSIFGVAVAGMIGDSLGRKKAMILSALLFTVSAAGCAVSASFSELVAYRIVGGVGIGMVSIISPLYISEVSVPEHRGRLVSMYQLAITVGFLGAYIANYALLQFESAAALSESGLVATVFGAESWRGMLGMETLPAALFLAIIFFIPESPRWLVLKRREAEAAAIVGKIYLNKQDASRELSNIRSAIGSEERVEWRELLRPGVRKMVAVGVAIAILGQFMGVNAVLYYGPSIFTDSGLSGGDSLFYQVLVGSVNMLTTVLALLIIDKVGRKKLVYYGVGGMIVSLVLISVYFAFGSSLGLSPLLLLAFFLAYIFCCAISICVVVWVLLSEMYPTKVRGLAMSIAGFSLWIGTYLIGQLTPWMLLRLTPVGTFMLFAVMCVPYIVIVHKCVPETKGLSLEEIERITEKENKH